MMRTSDVRKLAIRVLQQSTTTAVSVAEERGHLPLLPVRVGPVDHLAGAVAERDSNMQAVWTRSPVGR